MALLITDLFIYLFLFSFFQINRFMLTLTMFHLDEAFLYNFYNTILW